MRYLILVWLGVMSVCTVGKPQSAQSVFLNNNTAYSPEQTTNSLVANWPQNNCDNAAGCYAVIQFVALPTEQQRQELAAQGILLFDYIPNTAYLATYNGLAEVSLPDYVLQVVPLIGANKRPNSPFSPDDTPEGNETYELLALPFPTVSTIELAAALEVLSATIIEVNAEWVHCVIPADQLPAVLDCPLLRYSEPAPVTPFPEGDLGRASSRIPYSDQGLPGLDGFGIGISIGDDGGVNHLDVSGRLFDHTNFDTGPHGELTVGMSIGGGNINPATRGSAPRAFLHLFDIGNYNHITEAQLNFETLGTPITSTSFGAGCGVPYGVISRQIDDQVQRFPHLLHVFSAGNSGLQPCFNNYGLLGPNEFGRYFANITGPRKIAKNVFTIGNLEFDDQLATTSSAGPSNDGRLKPEVVALGQLDFTMASNNSYQYSSGTSAAAPNAAGGLALLYQYYRDTHFNSYPSSALIKALAMNSADDLGVAGPDFQYGWGRLNVRKALRGLEGEHYVEAIINHQEQFGELLVIPAGTQRVKVMLYWHDPEASVLSARALVNDLDLKLIGPDGQVYLPWIANSELDLESLQSPAQPGYDRLNNVEQVQLLAPAAGTYEMVVDGYQVPEGPQPFTLVYEVEAEPITMVSPQPGQQFVPGESALITWDAVSNGQAFNLQVSFNNGQNWQTIATDLAANTRSFLWTVPTVSTAALRFRLQRGGATHTNGHQGVIAAQVNFSTAFESATSARITWTGVPGATAYRIYRMGEIEMEPIAIAYGLHHDIEATVGQRYWLSVAPIFSGGLEGRRAIAQEYEHFGCETEVTLNLRFDQRPWETAWYILDATGNIQATGGPYVNAAANSFLQESVCLPEGCFTLVVIDSDNNGMCCNSGNGFYQLLEENGNLLLSGAQFNNSDINLFCVSANQNLPDLEVDAIVVNPINCANNPGGAVQAQASGGSGSYTYTWSTGSSLATLTNLTAGTYSVTVNDGNQSQVATVVLTAPSILEASAQWTNPVCNTLGDISLSISGGQAPYTISWSDGATGWNRSQLPAGQYYALVTDALGCLTSVNVPLVDSGSPPLVTQNINQPLCHDSHDGWVSLSVSGGVPPYSYTWEDGSTQSYRLFLGSGTYLTTITDALGCTTLMASSLQAPEPLSVEVTTQSALNGSGGAAQVSVSGGTAPYSYVWSNGGITNSQYNLFPGTYQVLVTDQKGCTEQQQFVIFNIDDQNDPPSGPVEYCEQEGNTPFEWIASVGVNDDFYTSGNDEGYGNHLQQVFNLPAGEMFSLQLTPGYASNPYREYWRVWIDYNQDGDFMDNGELVLSYGPHIGLLQANLSAMGNQQGTTRMRVAMQYGSLPSLCMNLGYGEVEDYTISWVDNLTEDEQVTAGLVTGEMDGVGTELDVTHTHACTRTQGAIQNSDLFSARLFPNPVQQQTNLERYSKQEQQAQIQLFSLTGQLVWQQDWYLVEGENLLPLDVANLPAGLYHVVVQTANTRTLLKMTKQ